VRQRWDRSISREEDQPRSGDILIEASLVHLNEQARLPYLSALIAQKTAGTEKQTLSAADVALYGAEYERLMVRLVEAGEASKLPDLPTAHDALNNLLLRLRGVR
jgi:hypothetical protein